MGKTPKKLAVKKVAAPRAVHAKAPSSATNGKPVPGQVGNAASEVSSAFLQLLNNPALVLRASDLRIMAANPAACTLYGYSNQKLIQKTFTELTLKSEQESLQSKVQAAAKGRKEVHQYEKDGTQILVEFEVSPCRFQGQPSLICVLNEITARAELLRALLESDAANREIIENASDIIYTHDLRGNFTAGNKAVETILGYNRDETIHMNIADVVIPEDQVKASRAIADKLAGKKTASSYRLRVRNKSGQELTVEVSTRLVMRDGIPIGVQGIARDITQHIRAEAALKESEAQFRSVAENAPCAIVIYQGSKFKYMNPTTELMTGYSAKELLQFSSFWDIAAPQYREKIKQRAEARMRGEFLVGRYEFQIVHKSGDLRWMDFTAGNITYQGQPAVVVMVFDISDRKNAELAAQQTQQLFRTVIEHSSDVITIIDQDGVIRYQSPSLLSVLDYRPEEIVGKSGFDFIHPDDLSMVKDVIARSFHPSTKKVTATELRLRHKNGQWVTFEAAGNTFLDKDSSQGLMVSLRDVSLRKRQEEARRATEEKYRQLFERNLAGVFRSSMDGRFLSCNQSFAQIFGYDSPEEVLAISPWALSVNDQGRSEFIDLVYKQKSFTNLESQLRRKDGSLVWVLENVSLVQGSEEEGDVLEGTLIDITERKLAEKALMESESKFRAVSDTAASAIYIHNGKRFLYANQASEEISGYSESELMDMDPFDIVYPDDREMVLQRARNRTSGGTVPDRYEYRILRKDGAIRWVDFSAGIMQFEGQTAIIGTAFDITERKRVEALQSALYQISDRADSAGDLNKFFAAIHQIVGGLMNARNLYIAFYDDVNQTVSYPYYVDEYDSQPGGSYPLGKGLTEYVLRTGKHLLATPEKTNELHQASEVDPIGTSSVDWLGVPLKSSGKAVGVIAVQSYHESVRYTERDVEVLNFVSQHLANAILRKRNEEALRDSESRFRSLVQSAVYGIYRSSADDRFVEVNPALVKMLGYDSADDVLDLSLSRDVYAHSEERAQLIERHALEGQIEGIEVKWKRKDHRLITVRLSGRGVMNAQNELEAFEMIAEDVTERRALEEQLRQSQKMEAIGRLAGGVAHDFNNLLTVIKGYSELMLDELKDADPMRSEVEEIRKAADRAATLTRQLLAFSRQQVLAPKVLDLNSVVINMDKLLNRLLGEDIGLFTVLESGLGRVKADPGQIEQVVMNLAVNARDAMPRGGKLTVETANVELDENYVREHVGSRPGSFVMLAVSDNGTGMTPEVRQRIFEPFFTTKELGKGTGLGLSTVYGIVKQSEGYIWVYSEVNHGTSFKVYLPRVDAPVEVSNPRSSQKPSHRGTETVLLVEDEDGVRALVRQVLHKHGYTVLEARHGGEALLHCERHEGPIQLLLTDVVLEQMGGPELARRLAGIRPDMKVLYISGYTDDAIIHHGVLTAGTAFLQKPFTTEALAKKIRQVLEG